MHLHWNVCKRKNCSVVEWTPAFRSKWLTRYSVSSLKKLHLFFHTKWRCPRQTLNAILSYVFAQKMFPFLQISWNTVRCERLTNVLEFQNGECGKTTDESVFPHQPRDASESSWKSLLDIQWEFLCTSIHGREQRQMRDTPYQGIRYALLVVTNTQILHQEHTGSFQALFTDWDAGERQDSEIFSRVVCHVLRLGLRWILCLRRENRAHGWNSNVCNKHHSAA